MLAPDQRRRGRGIDERAEAPGQPRRVREQLRLAAAQLERAAPRRLRAEGVAVDAPERGDLEPARREPVRHLDEARGQPGLGARRGREVCEQLRARALGHRPLYAAGHAPGLVLCGGVRFEIAKAVGPFELCHCNRCRKSSGSAFAAFVGVEAADYRLLAGAEWIASYDAPILRAPPAYRSSFCRRCGSPVPNPDPAADWFEIPAGLLEGDPQLAPDKHIFVELRAPWFEHRGRRCRASRQPSSARGGASTAGARRDVRRTARRSSRCATACRKYAEMPKDFGGSAKTLAA